METRESHWVRRSIGWPSNKFANIERNPARIRLTLGRSSPRNSSFGRLFLRCSPRFHFHRTINTRFRVRHFAIRRTRVSKNRNQWLVESTWPRETFTSPNSSHRRSFRLRSSLTLALKIVERGKFPSPISQCRSLVIESSLRGHGLSNFPRWTSDSCLLSTFLVKRAYTTRQTLWRACLYGKAKKRWKLVARSGALRQIFGKFRFEPDKLWRVERVECSSLSF